MVKYDFHSSETVKYDDKILFLLKTFQFTWWDRQCFMSFDCCMLPVGMWM